MTVERTKLEALIWKHTHRDRRGTGSDGVRRILHLNPATGGTESWPLAAFTDEQLIAKLPLEVRAILTKMPAKDS